MPRAVKVASDTHLVRGWGRVRVRVRDRDRARVRDRARARARVRRSHQSERLFAASAFG